MDHDQGVYKRWYRMTAEAVGPAVISKGLMTSKEFEALLTTASSAKHALLFKLFDHGRVGRISIHLISLPTSIKHFKAGLTM
jgi:hypothetical protein